MPSQDLSGFRLVDFSRVVKTADPNVKNNPVKLEYRDVGFTYTHALGAGNTPFKLRTPVTALKDISLGLRDRCVTAFIGPSGCGKSTLVRIPNQIYKVYNLGQPTGELFLDGTNVLTKKTDLLCLRAKVCLVFQQPTPFPKSIFDNVACGIRLQQRVSKSELADRVEDALRRSALWNRVSHKLRSSGLSLSGGEQQRLCIARGIAIEPEVFLFDEPTSSLDSSSTAQIEELIAELKQNYCIGIVTHNMQQAARSSDFTAFMVGGEIVEFDETERIFTNPKQKRTEDYITGRFG